jgi:hypothetical protein
MRIAENYGLCMCRLHMEGQETVFGIPLDVVAGSTLGEKEATLGKMTVQHLLATVDAQGFSYRATVGSLNLIPGRFAVIVCGSADAKSHGLQWFLPAGDANMTYARKHIYKLQQERPELNTPTSMQTQLIEYLTSKLG